MNVKKKLPRGISYHATRKLYFGRKSVVLRDGSPKRITTAYFSSIAEAQDALAKASRQAVSLDPAKYTIESFLTEWIEYIRPKSADPKKPQVRPKTFENRAQALGPLLPASVGLGKRVGSPAFESLRTKPLRDFTDTDLRAFLDRQTTHGIGSRTVQTSYEALRAAWKYAIQRRYVDGDSPFLRVDRPHHDAKPKSPMSDADYAKLIAEIDATPLVRSRTLLQLLVTTGLRSSEALALTWENITLDGSEAEVRVRVQLGEDGEAAPLKTKESRREVFLMAHVVEGLRELKGAARSAWVFETAKSAKPLDRNNLRTKMLAPVVKRAGLADRGITVHTLRGIAATLLAPEVEAATLTRLFGWSDIKTAMKYYARSSGTMREAGREGMRRQLERLSAPASAA